MHWLVHAVQRVISLLFSDELDAIEERHLRKRQKRLASGASGASVSEDASSDDDMQLNLDLVEVKVLHAACSRGPNTCTHWASWWLVQDKNMLNNSMRSFYSRTALSGDNASGTGTGAGPVATSSTADTANANTATTPSATSPSVPMDETKSNNAVEQDTAPQPSPTASRKSAASDTRNGQTSAAAAALKRKRPTARPAGSRGSSRASRVRKKGGVAMRGPGSAGRGNSESDETFKVEVGVTRTRLGVGNISSGGVEFHAHGDVQ